MNRHQSSSVIRAPYGRACMDCSQSKCKCLIRRVDGRCERCHRLNKECRPSVTVRRRKPKKVAVSKLAQTEENVDDLVTLLKAGMQSEVNANDVRVGDETRLSSHCEGGSVTSVSSDCLGNAPVVSFGKIIPGGASSNDLESILYDAAEPSPVVAEEYLATFHAYKSKYFPFVYIPPTTTAPQLRQERPFLWLCIMTIASRSTSQQQVLGKKIRGTLAQEMLLKSEQSIDLLLGLLAYIGWINYQVQSKPSLSVYTQLATSLVYDLGLNKTLHEDSQVSLCAISSKHSKPSTIRTMEERRAVLGCFLVTSNVSSFLRKIDALRWTSHMDECLEVLGDSQVCLNDEILVHQVRLQLIVEKITIGIWSEGATLTDGHINVPLSFYVQALHVQLKETRDRISPQLLRNEVVLAHLYSTELSINEITFSQVPTATNFSDLKQLKRLYACVASIRSWFEVFLAIPPSDYIGFPFLIFSQLVHCLATLYRLSTLNDSHWDKGSVRETTDLLPILDQVINNMDRVAAVAGLDNSDTAEGDVFSRTARKFRSIRLEWEAKLGPHDLTISAIPTPHSADATLTEAFSADFPDNDWMMDFLLDPN